MKTIYTVIGLFMLAMMFYYLRNFWFGEIATQDFRRGMVCSVFLIIFAIRESAGYSAKSTAQDNDLAE